MVKITSMKSSLRFVAISLLFVPTLWFSAIFAQDSISRGLVTQISVSGNGDVIAVTYLSEPDIDLFSTTTGELLQTVQIPVASRERTALSPSGDRLIWTSGVGDIHLYNLDNESSRTILAEGAASLFDDIYWSPIDESIIVWTLGRRVNFYDVDEDVFIGSFLSSLEHVVDIAFSPDGSLVATSHFIQSPCVSQWLRQLRPKV
jgi:WD40 repeat protein